MRVKLKENPREWQKFTASMAVLLVLIAGAFWKRHVISSTVLILTIILLSLTVLTCLIRPRWFRLFYRAGMTFSTGIGHVVGAVLLALFFFCVLTPLGLIMRLFGKDLLKLKKNPGTVTYWLPTKANENFDQQF